MPRKSKTDSKAQDSSAKAKPATSTDKAVKKGKKAQQDIIEEVEEAAGGVEVANIVEVTEEKVSKKSKQGSKDDEETEEVVTVKKIKGTDEDGNPVEVIKKTEKTEEVKVDKTQKTIVTKEATTVTIGTILPREFYTRDVVTLSKELLGKILVRKIDGKIVAKAKIVEVEAYAGIPDKACHAYNGKKTDRVKAMYLEGGHVYVYSIYGNNYCLNITASKDGDPSAALIRAVEITEGKDFAIQNRPSTKLSKTQKELTNGPGKLCAALKIGKEFNGHDVTKDGELYIVEDKTPFEVLVTKRININYAEEYVHKPWRFCIKNNVCISAKGDPADPETEKDA